MMKYCVKPEKCDRFKKKDFTDEQKTPLVMRSHITLLSPPSSPGTSICGVNDVRFLRQYHSTVHREITEAVHKYTGLPRTLHPAQVGHRLQREFY